jgi:N-sulfoglucosamine sulfohydrolase
MKQWQEETDDSCPDNLTRDWYDRENGTRLQPKQIRGEMPGGEKAMRTTGKGPF